MNATASDRLRLMLAIQRAEAGGYFGWAAALATLLRSGRQEGRISQGSLVAKHLAHNQETAASIPAPASTSTGRPDGYNGTLGVAPQGRTGAWSSPLRRFFQGEP